MKKALVTGGAGFIGSHLVDKLVSKGWYVRVVDNFSSGRLENVEHHRSNSRVEVSKGDLKDPRVAEESVKDVDIVFHYAANPEVRVSTTNPEVHFNENILATFNLLEAMRKRGVREIVFASSSSIYGEPEAIPVTEDASMRPVSVYGASKAACENLIHAYSKLYGIKAIVLRYANVVGPRLRHGVVYDFIVKLGRNAEELEILGDGNQVRSYIYVDDAVEATMVAYYNSEKLFNVYNVASEDWITINEVAEAVTHAIGLRSVKYAYKPVLHGVGWIGDVKQIALDVSKLKELGWRPRMRSREAVAKAASDILHELKSHNA
ncbi:MAG: SDR family NAD(P)-dependent oxidoreductase [Crenarchaeota archaeon]|nr:SDR family NAD(P)-dependent oxidoreductase [Thermoproteota archaeon]